MYRKKSVHVRLRSSTFKSWRVLKLKGPSHYTNFTCIEQVLKLLVSFLIVMRSCLSEFKLGIQMYCVANFISEGGLICFQLIYIL